jgi:hypothetical protein
MLVIWKTCIAKVGMGKSPSLYPGSVISESLHCKLGTNIGHRSYKVFRVSRNGHLFVLGHKKKF